MAQKAYGEVTLGAAEARVRREVYAACATFELLEGAGSVRGDGRQMARRVAEYAARILRERWAGPVEEPVRRSGS